MIRAFRLFPDVILPHRAHDYDAAFDVHAYESANLTRMPRKIGTGLVMSVPPGYVIMVLSRSGLATDHGIVVANAPGLLDPGYRGELGVTLINLGERMYRVTKGDRIAQLLVVKYAESDIDAIGQVADLHDPPDARGTGGFGSTGK